MVRSVRSAHLEPMRPESSGSRTMSETPTAQAFTDHSLRLAQIANPQSEIVHFDEPLPLDCGAALAPFCIAYQTYGTLNADKSNVVLVCHALTGDQHVANIASRHRQARLVGDHGRPRQADRHRPLFRALRQRHRRLHGLDRPELDQPGDRPPLRPRLPGHHHRDMVRAQARLLDHLGIAQLLCVLGGSMGGMQVLEWAATYQDRVFSAVPIACAARHSSQNIAFHEVGRQAVMADPDWCQGRYLDEGKSPRKGLAVARMAAHITYLSDDALHRKFGRNLQDRDKVTFGFDADFQVESYLRHQGLTFVDRFDANSYLYITRAMDYFDLAADHGGVLANAFAGTKTRFCLVSFTRDWLFPTEESREIVHALNAVAANVSFVEIKTDKGHDAFLLHEPELFDTIRGFLARGGAEARHCGAEGMAAMNVNVPPHAVRARPIRARVDLLLIADMVTPGSRVLDVGCGDGTLLRLLADKQRRRRPRHRAQPGGREFLRGARPVGDPGRRRHRPRLLSRPRLRLRHPVADHPGDLFAAPRARAAARASASARSCRSPISAIGGCGPQLLFGGTMPRTDNLPDRWYDTPNIHLCTINDFVDLCDDVGAKVERAVALNAYGRKLGVAMPLFAQNLFGEQAVFLLSR